VSRFEGRVALITGGSRGMGLVLCARFAGEGACVVSLDVADIAGRLDELPDDVRGRVTSRKTDIRRPEDVEEAVTEILSHHGRIDILVNNAAVFTSLARKPLEQLTPAEWQDVFAVNVTGTFLCIRAVTAPMRALGGGKIINVASNVVFTGVPMLLHYVASKGAVLAMTRAAARELGPDNIAVNAVAPGYMRHSDFQGWDPGRDEQVITSRSLSRTQTPQDVVGAVLFLASNESDFVTGQTIVVDGGEILH